MILGDLKQPNIDSHKMLHDDWGPKKTILMLTRCYMMFGDLKQPNIDAHKMLDDA